MTIFTEARIGESFIEDIEAPFSDELAARFKDQWVRNPLPSTMRMLELRNAQQGTPIGVGSDMGEVQFDEPSPMLPAEEARARVKEEGIYAEGIRIPDTGMRREALEIILRRKYEERKIQNVIARGPAFYDPHSDWPLFNLAQTVGAWGLRFGAGLFAAALDPLNVSASFIPVVGKARAGLRLPR